MHGIIYTLHEFMLHTKTITYILMGVGLIALTTFWCFLTDREDD